MQSFWPLFLAYYYKSYPTMGTPIISNNVHMITVSCMMCEYDLMRIIAHRWELQEQPPSVSHSGQLHCLLRYNGPVKSKSINDFSDSNHLLGKHKKLWTSFVWTFLFAQSGRGCEAEVLRVWSGRTTPLNPSALAFWEKFCSFKYTVMVLRIST